MASWTPTVNVLGYLPYEPAAEPSLYKIKTPVTPKEVLIYTFITPPRSPRTLLGTPQMLTACLKQPNTVDALLLSQQYK